MVDTKVTCLLLSLPRKREERSIKEKAQAVLSRCLLACSSASWEAGLAVLGNLCIFHLHWAKSPSFSPMVPQQCLVLSKLQGGRSEQTPGRKVALPSWPGSHGVRCVSLLRYTLPASAGGANSPRNTRPGRSQWCCEMSEALLHVCASPFSFPWA